MGERLTSKQSEFIRTRDNFTCLLCGQKHDELQVHHIVRLCQGGTHNPYNLATVCSPCHGVLDRSEGGRHIYSEVGFEELTEKARRNTERFLQDNEKAQSFRDSFYYYGV